MVLGNNKSGVSCKCAVDELIIVRVLGNQPQFKLGVKELHIVAIHQRINDMLCNNRAGFGSNNLLVFCKYII